MRASLPRPRFALGLCAVLALLVATPAAGRSDVVRAKLSYLDNGTIRLGVDLDDGGTITYLARSRTRNADVLHDVQQVYHDGAWQVGAAGGEVVESTNNGKTIYTKVVPRTGDGTPCACVLESWVTLAGAVANVRNRLTSDRAGPGPQAATAQELPAIRTTGTAYRLFTYDGRAPYTGAPVRRLSGKSSFAATEHWAALVGTGGRGVGLFVPELTRFSGSPGTSAGVDQGGANGSLSATAPEIIDAKIVYSSRYALVLGTLLQIRAYARSHRPEARPSYRFASDRRHWWYRNAGDEGSPTAGALRIRLDRQDPQLIGPEQWWEASSAPTLYVRGAWHTAQSTAEIRWSIPGQGFDERRRLFLHVAPDGRFLTYRVRLASSRLYKGPITGLRLDPVASEDIGGFADISCISWKPCPVDRAAEARLEAEPLARPYRDGFDGTLGRIWHTSGSGTGATLALANGKLEVLIRADAQGGQGFGAHIGTNCKLHGDFDVQVDYELLAWPTGNGVQAFLGTYYGPAPNWESITRQSQPWGELYDARIAGSYSSTLTSDLRGALRLTRSGDTLTASSREGTGWRVVAARVAVLEPAVITVGAGSYDGGFADRDVRIAFDDFSVNSGRLRCG
jgi:hypothetical protein